MAAQTPFQISSDATTGKSIVIETSAISSGATVIGSVIAVGFAPALILTHAANGGTGKMWVRLSGETSPTVTSADHCMLPNTVQLFSNPQPTGTLHIGVMISLTTSSFPTLFVTPGQGSI